MAQAALQQIVPGIANNPGIDAAVEATFGDGDVNGDLFIGNGSGEQEEESLDLICWIPPFEQQIPNLTLPIHQCVHADSKKLALKYVTAYNYYMLVNGGFPWSNNLDLCAKVAYLRALVVSKGVSDHMALPNAKHCLYTLFREGPYSLSAILLADDAQINACVLHANQAQIQGAPLVTARNLTYLQVTAYLTRNAGVAAAEQTTFKMLDNQTTSYLRKIFVDLVCIVAWYFRATGHHYNTEADERIGRVWKGCIHADQRTDCGIPWIHICRTAFKCIFPIDLEEFWNGQAEALHCSRPLILRLSTYPAGSAAYGAVLKGYMDVSTVFPMFDQRFANIGAELTRVSTVMAEVNNPIRKMGLSINARFYGQQRIALDESVLASCAATILACLNAFTERNPLGKSKALQRAGNGAPITGSVIGKALLAISNSEEYHKTLLAIGQ